MTPALLEYQEWGLTAPQVGVITSYGLAVVGLLGCVFIAAVPRSPAEAVRDTSPSPQGAAQ